MANFSDIQREIENKETPYDLVRRKYLNQLYEKTGRNVILYYSGWLQKPIPSLNPLMIISDNDKNGFMSAINGLDTSKGLDLILHTPDEIYLQQNP